MRTKLYVLTFLGILLTVGGLARYALAADTDTVTATVTVQQISVSLDNADGIAFGTLVAGGSEDTTTNGVNDSTTATNDGNILEDFNITAADTANWTLAADAGDGTYSLDWCTQTCDTSPTWASVGVGGYTELADSVAALGTSTFDLQVGVPTATLATAAQSIVVTVQAAQHTP